MQAGAHDWGTSNEVPPPLPAPLSPPPQVDIFAVDQHNKEHMMEDLDNLKTAIDSSSSTLVWGGRWLLVGGGAG